MVSHALTRKELVVRKVRRTMIARRLARERVISQAISAGASYNRLVAILRSQGVSVYRARNISLGSAFTFLGVPCIIISEALRPREAKIVLLHELAHVWFHVHDLSARRGELERRRDHSHRGWLSPKQRSGSIYLRVEEEADLAAAMLLGIDLPEIRRQLSAIDLRLSA